jgi:hypothetical protein
MEQDKLGRKHFFDVVGCGSTIFVKRRKTNKGGREGIVIIAVLADKGRRDEDNTNDNKNMGLLYYSFYMAGKPAWIQ